MNFSGAAVAVNAPVNWGHWVYNVVCLRHPVSVEIHTKANGIQTLDGVPQQYNASTYWLEGNSVLFFQSGLDPAKEHEIKLINTGGDGMVMDLNDITVYTPPNMISIRYALVSLIEQSDC